MRKQGISAVAAAVGGVAAVAAAVPMFVKPPQKKTASEHGREWMSVLRDDTPLSAIAIPGTHDSGSEKIYCAGIARCQHLSVAQQLEAGCRFLDLRLAVKGDRLVLIHGAAAAFCEKNKILQAYTLDALTESLYAFLKQHPTETVLVSVKMDRGSNADRFVELLYENYIQFSRRFWYTENRIPALGEVRGRAVLIRRFSVSASALNDADGGLNMNGNLWMNTADKKCFGYQKFHMEHFDDGADAGTVCLQDCYGLGVDAKWFRAVKPLLDRGRFGNELVLNFMSCTGRLFPVATALPLNRRFAAYDGGALQQGGIVCFDFLDAPLAEKVYRQNRKHIDAEKRYPGSNHPYSENRDGAAARYVLGYSNLLYRIFDR